MAGKLALAAVVAIGSLTASAAGAMGAVKPYDFNGDGRQDLVSVLPYFHTPSNGAGAAMDIRFTRTGKPRSMRLFSYATPGIKRFWTPGSGLGGGVASGDFNDDGYADLVMSGWPRLIVVYGTKNGLDPHRSQSWSEPMIRFHDPAAGDLDGDGYDDVAVDIQEVQDINNSKDVEVALIRGGPDGLRPTRSGTLPVVGKLKITDLDRDRHPELVVGEYPGMAVCRGTATGPHSCNETSSGGAGWDTRLATGDVTGNGRREVVVGEPGRNAVAIYRYTRGRLQLAFRITQSTRHVPGNTESFDQFGAAVAVGRVGRDRKQDILIGAPMEDENRGRVTLVRGSKFGIARHGNRAYDMDTPGIPRHSQRDAYFGASLALLDHNGDRRLDLDVGAPSWGPNGVVVDIPGGRNGLRPRKARTFDADDVGFNGDPYNTPTFGSDLAQ